MNVALTGGIASGKSSVTRYLGKICWAQVFDADQICYDLLQKNRPGWNGLCDRWGKRFLDQKGEVDRVGLRRAVFSDKRIRHKLENILHPLVRSEIEKLCMKANRENDLCFYEIPLLFEVGWQKDFDWVITVYATRLLRLERICNRDKVSMKEAEKVLAAQMDISTKVLGSHSVIDNSGLWIDTCLQMHHLANVLADIGENLDFRPGFIVKNP